MSALGANNLASPEEKPSSAHSSPVFWLVLVVILAAIVWGLPRVFNNVGNLPPWKWVPGAHPMKFGAFDALNYY